MLNLMKLALCAGLSLLAASSADAVAVDRNFLTPRAAPADLQELAVKFAPLIRFHPSERYFATSVDYFLSRVTLRDGNGNLVANQPAQLTPYNLDFLRARGQDGSGTYLTVSTSVDTNGDELPVASRWLYGDRNMAGVPIYAMAKRKDNGVVDLIFWAFNPFISLYASGTTARSVLFRQLTPSFPPKKTLLSLGKDSPIGRYGNHVGDWEHIIVRTQNGQAIALDYHTHGGQGVRVVPANDRRVQWVGTHPVVYSSLGSHGFWPQAGSNTYKTVAIVYDLVDETGNGVEWQTWGNVSTIEYTGSYSGPDTFLNFAGRYGNPAINDCTFQSLVGGCKLGDGPTGPARDSVALGPLDWVLATPGGDFNTVSFSLTPGAANRAAREGYGFVAAHVYCPGTNILGDSGDVERWGFTAFKGTGDRQYNGLRFDRCRKGRDRRVDRYEVAFCRSADAGSCTVRSGYRKVRAFNNGAQTDVLGATINDLDSWNL
ncbi:Vacuolar protein sorting-associated protein 62 [Phlyctochytrium bullatum]|nr:Vacuolar protein sorting-associated protein 62 [Phlyctochytrium bullatum]